MLLSDLTRYVSTLADRLGPGAEGKRFRRRVLRNADTCEQAARNATKAIHRELDALTRKHREREESIRARGTNRDDLVVIHGGKTS